MDQLCADDLQAVRQLLKSFAGFEDVPSCFQEICVGFGRFRSAFVRRSTKVCYV